MTHDYKAAIAWWENFQSGEWNNLPLDLATQDAVQSALKFAEEYQWRDIESAPNNTTPPILAYSPRWEQPKIICYKKTYTLEMCWHEYDGGPLPDTPHSQPTHWMPLPKLPKREGE